MSTIKKIYYSVMAVIFTLSLLLVIVQKNWFDTRHDRDFSSLSQEKQDKYIEIHKSDITVRRRMRDIERYYMLGDEHEYSDLLTQTTDNRIAMGKIWREAPRTQSFSRKIYSTLGVINE